MIASDADDKESPVGTSPTSFSAHPTGLAYAPPQLFEGRTSAVDGVVLSLASASSRLHYLDYRS